MSNKIKTVIALGYFDSLHNGHRLVLEQAKSIAKSKGVSFTVFTFISNVKAFFSKQADTSVYTAEERREILLDFGADQVFFAPVNQEFLSLERHEFLSLLNEKYDVVAYVSGKDFKFGKNGKGDAEFLSEYAKNTGRTYHIVDTVNYNEEKISTTRIKSLLKDGKIKEANAMLGRPYSVSGSVYADRQVGQKLGFPTLNIKLPLDKFILKNGVYKGHSFVDGVKYNAIINYGARPTFNLEETIVETHLIDFDGDLYGKKVTVFFDCFMRDIIKFDSVDALKQKINGDLNAVREGKYD